MKKYCLLIGDGFTKDFVGSSFDTSMPLHHFKNNAIPDYYKFFFKHIKNIHNELISLISQKKLTNEFEAIELFSKINKDNTPKECQLRRYLALSYSSLQRELDKKTKLNWKWFNWLKSRSDHLLFAISFNYDLLLESTLQDARIDNFRVSTNEPSNGLPIFKPHGSIDFDIIQPEYMNPLDQADIAFSIWNNYFSLNSINEVVQVIPTTHFLLPRLQADIIPPSQDNFQRHLEWVDKGFSEYSKIANQITDFVIIGHSYSLPDRKEINFFLENLNSNAVVHIVNPSDSIDLISKLDELNLNYKLIKDVKSLPE